MYRSDGSYRSSNVPEWDNRYQLRDYGIYRGVVRDVIYTDDERNDSGDGDPNEVVYSVMVIGGERDGQVFDNARLMRTLGGFANFEQIILKKLEGVTKADPANAIALGDPTISEVSKFNGDVVYVQFVNGDPHLPLIIGLGYHQAADPEATEDDGQLYQRQFNGIFTEITKDGEFTWSKDNGASVPLFPNSADPLYPFVNQFAPLPGQEQAVKFSLDNEYNLDFEFLTGLSVAISGLEDTFTFTTAAGAAWAMNGITDSHEFSTTVGTTVAISGIEDSINLTTAAGAAISISGLTDEISLDSAFGDSLSVSAANGIQASTPTGTALSMKNGEVSIDSAAANLTLDKTGFIKLGNASGDVLKDVLQALIQSLSMATYSGFGAPGSNVADLVQLLAKIQLITGG